MSYKLFLRKLFCANLCISCSQSVDFPEMVCDVCKKELAHNKRYTPKSVTYKDSKYLVHCVYKYAGAAGDIVKCLKYVHRYQASEFIASELYKMINRKHFGKIDYITYVPMAKVKEIKRGFSQTELIALKLSKLLNIKYKKLLYKPFDTKPQQSLLRESRINNLNNKFRAKRKCKGKNIMLIDDVCTTGTTLCECSKTLHKKGANKVILVSFVGT